MGNIPPSALRQPPPPGRRRQLIDAKTRPSPTPSRVRSRANPSNAMIESLPDELLIDILLRLSDDEIHDSARLVCRLWRHLIHSDAFVHEHFHRSSSGLLLTPLVGHSWEKNYPLFVTTTMQGRVETSRFSCTLDFPILCSCNGLALCLREDDGCRKTPFIFNPATKSAFYLPSFPVTGQRQLMHGRGRYRLGMAYAAASMAYKVVGSYLDLEAEEQCAILTVGVDNEWRHVEAVEGLSPEAKCAIMMYTPLMTRGFLHWVSETHVLSLNVETEIFKLTPAPTLMLDEYFCLSTGKYLSFFVCLGDWSWEVWEMKPETWEWRKVIPCLDLEAHKCKIQQLVPRECNVRVTLVGWVRYPEVLAFFVNSWSLIIYYLDTEEFESIELSLPDGYNSVVHHRNSLVWSERF